MKSLHVYIFLFGITFCSCFSLHAQNEVEQKVERYLYTSYDINKTSLKEGERILRTLEEQLNTFLFAAGKAELAALKGKEKEFDDFLKQIDGIKEVAQMEQIVEESRKSYRSLIAAVTERGIADINDAHECRKAIVLKMMEMDLLRLKQEKLVLLLKDESLRGLFINTMMSSGKLGIQTDVRTLMSTVDRSVAEYEI